MGHIVSKNGIYIDLDMIHALNELIAKEFSHSWVRSISLKDSFQIMI